jgi:hypothetical protein
MERANAGYNVCLDSKTRQVLLNIALTTGVEEAHYAVDVYEYVGRIESGHHKKDDIAAPSHFESILAFASVSAICTIDG